MKVTYFDLKGFRVITLGKDLVQLIYLFLWGFLDSLRVDALWKVLVPGSNSQSNEKVQRVIVSCIILNAIVVGVMLIQNWVIEPVLDLYTLNLMESNPDDAAMIYIVSMSFGIFIKVFYFMVWLVAMTAFSFARSNTYYGDLAATMPPPIPPKAPPPKTSAGTFSSAISEASADVLFYVVQLLIFKVANGLIAFIPFTGWWISALLQCLLASFYAFESHWNRIHPGQPAGHFIYFIERDWAYFLGYGVVMTALTIEMEFFISFALYAGLLPIFIILAGRRDAGAWRSTTVRHNFEVLPRTIRYFAVGSKLSDVLSVVGWRIYKRFSPQSPFTNPISLPPS